MTFDDIILELQRYGLQYTGSDEKEARAVLDRTVEDRKGKPLCYARSYVPKDPKCRACELLPECQVRAIIPKIDLLEQTEPLPCDVCDGELVVELCDAAGRVLDYGCTTPGCRNTRTEQMEKRADGAGD